jgi:atypical dual specificity phosphatase
MHLPFCFGFRDSSLSPLTLAKSSQTIVSMTEQPFIQPIAQNLWWVIPGKLAGVRKPQLEELSDLQAVGVGAIVSVMDDSSNLDIYQQANIPYCWLPTKGGTAPRQEQIEELQNFVDQQNRIGNAVAIHCTSGRRRTGTMLAAYLINAGSSYSEAMQAIQSANAEVDLRDAQTAFLKQLAGE